MCPSNCRNGKKPITNYFSSMDNYIDKLHEYVKRELIGRKVYSPTDGEGAISAVWFDKRCYVVDFKDRRAILPMDAPEFGVIIEGDAEFPEIP